MLGVPKIIMKQASIRAVGLVFWFMSCQHAFGECGFAGAYAPESSSKRSDHSNQEEILAAHRSLPPGTRVVVRNQQRGRSIIVRILGPALSGVGEIIDLSAGAMRALGMEAPAPVCLEVLTYGSQSRGYEKLIMRNPLVEKTRLERRRYAKAGSRARLARDVRNTHKARAGSRSSKRYAKRHGRNQIARKSGRRQQSRARS